MNQRCLEKDVSQDFFNTDNSMYVKAYEILSQQKEALRSFLETIQAKMKQKENVKYLHQLEKATKALLNCSFGSLYFYATIYTEKTQEIIKNAPCDCVECAIGNNLLDICLRLSRIFSCVSGPISAGKTIKHEHDLPTESRREISEEVVPNSDNEYEEEDDEVVMCRICEEYVPVSLLAQHNESCLLAYESEFDMITTDSKLRKLLKNIRDNVLSESWPGEKHRTIDILLPLSHASTLIEHALADKDILSNTLEALSYIEVGSEYQQYIYRGRTLIAEKIRAAEAITEASEVLRHTRISGNTMGASSLQTTIADFTFIKRISSGAYAKVYLAEKTRTKDTYAIKVTPRNALKQKNDFRRTITEKDILLRSSNSYIVEFYYSIIGNNNLYLVMEFVPGGDLFSVLQNFGSFDEESAKIYTVQIIKALEYLHGNGVVHRDLKPDNILVTTKGKLKLTDFGLSLFGAFDRGIGEVVGTPGYIAPEILSSKEHSFTVDFWSLGVVLFEFLTGIPPFNRTTTEETYAAILSGSCDWSLLDGFSDDVIDLIKKLLVVEPPKRLGYNGISEIMTHKWFEGIDWNNIDNLSPPYIPDVKPMSTDCFEERYQFEESDTIEKDIINDIENAKKVMPRSVSMTDLSYKASDSDDDVSDSDYSANSDEIQYYSSIALQNLSRKSQGDATSHRRSFYSCKSNSFAIDKKHAGIPIPCIKR